MSFDIFQLSQMELQGFYGHDGDSLPGTESKPSPFLLHATTTANKATTPTLKFHNHFPPDVAT